MVVHIPGFQLALTADSGQSFRFCKAPEGWFSLVALGRHLAIKALDDDFFEFSCEAAEFELVWNSYFDLARDYSRLDDALRAEDGYLGEAYRFARGVKILRQDPFEALIGFIISQRKSIPAIRTCMEALSRRFGTQIRPGMYAFPSPEALATARPDDLKACGLGYRVSYVQGTARLVSEGIINLDSLREMDDALLFQSLLRFPGVGKKVAACVMLFAYQRMDAFPVDVWIQKVLDEQFPQGFPSERFMGVLGILQQYLFCYARHQAGRV